MANETLNTSAPTQPQLSVNLEQLRADFCAAAKQGSNPNIADYLQNVPADSSEKLLRELLAIEFACRVEKCEDFSAEEYRRRFPQFAPLVQQLYDQHVKHRELKGYEDLQFVGGGGMGVVYKARQIGLNRTVAVKFLADQCLNNAKMVARFQQEKQSIGLLNHDNIVQAYDAGEDRGRQFLVMEFVDGVCLTDLIKRRGTLPVADACEMGRQVCAGLEYARKKGVVHRDIKPSNLMVTREGTVKILDFGLARVKLDRDGDSDGGLTTDGTAMGTLDYMAPEQFEDAKNVDHRADLYSLGCTLFHLLAGRAPFGVPKYASELSKKKGHTMDPTPRVDELRPDVPPEVSEIISRLMAKHRTERFATAAEVAVELELFTAEANLVEYLDPGATVVDGIGGGGSSGALGRSRQETKKRSKTSPATAAGGLRGTYDALVRRVKRRPWLSATLAAGVAAAAVGSLVLFVNRDRSSSGEPQSGQVAQPSPVPPTKAPKPLIGLEQAVSTLPGLDGKWWFDDMPWLIPESRQHLAHWAHEHASAGRPLDAGLAQEVRDKLVAGINSSETEKLKSRLKKWAANSLPGEADDSDSEFAGRLANLLDAPPKTKEAQLQQLDDVQQMLWQIAGQTSPLTPDGAKAAIEKLPAAQCHLLANVWHKMALLSPAAADGAAGQPAEDRRSSRTPRTPQQESAAPIREQLFNRAEDAYKAAINKYHASDPQLGVLCRCDLGALYYDLGGHEHMLEAKYNFGRAVSRNLATSPFNMIYALARYADACAQLKDDNDATQALEEAEKIARDQLPEDHPLRAYVDECQGWAAMETLDYTSAQTHFSAALERRTKIGQGMSEPAIHDEHGTALAEQYEGVFPRQAISPAQRQQCLENSHRDFTHVIDKLNKLLDKDDPAYQRLSAQDLLELNERLRNALDRDADGFLYGVRDYKQAAKGYQQCIDLQAKEGLADIPDTAASRYKLVVALVSGGTPDVKVARDALRQADDYATTKLTEPQREDIQFVTAISRALVEWQESTRIGSPDSRTAALVEKLSAAFAKKIEQQHLGKRVRLLRNEQLALNQLLWVVDGGREALKESALEAAWAKTQTQPAQK